VNKHVHQGLHGEGFIYALACAVGFTTSRTNLETDRDAMAARLPSELAMYLRSQSWAVRARNGSSIQWVKTVDGEEFEALQPQESSIRDYPARVRDLLGVLAVAEDRSELEVLADINCYARCGSARRPASGLCRGRSDRARGTNKRVGCGP
jgi:hypothetical protein